MNNIIKSLHYQTRRDNFTIYAFLIAIGMIILNHVLMTIDYNIENITGSEYTTYFMYDMLPIVIMLFCIVLVPRICGWDYTDKTINYDILIGHSRKEVFFSRVIVAFTWALPSLMLLALVPSFLFSLFAGWGHNAELSDVLIRYVLLIFPLFRFICEFIMLTFLLKNFFAAMVIGFIYMEASFMMIIMVEEATDFQFNYILSVSNILSLCNYSNSKMGYVNGEDIQIYDFSLEPSYIIGTILVSLIMGTLCLLLAYKNFEKADMK